MCVCVCVGSVFYIGWYFSEEVNFEPMASDEEEPTTGPPGRRTFSAKRAARAGALSREEQKSLHYSLIQTIR